MFFLNSIYSFDKLMGVRRMESLYIIIPAYNERETIKSVIGDWYPVVERISPESRLVIVDDGSKDDTYDIILGESESRHQLIAITKENGGHGATVLFGYNYAISHGADYVFQTDSDGQTLPGEFWDFWDARQDYKMVIGYRNKREDGSSRILVTKVLKAVIRLCFGVSVKDANTPFRLMESKTLEEQLELVPKDFNLSNVMISVIYVKKKLSVKWLPITFRPRQGGVNSINLKKICKIGKQAIKDFRTLNMTIK